MVIGTVAAAHNVVLFASAGTTAALAAVAYRHRRLPGATSFALLAVALTNWSLAYGVGLQIHEPVWRLLLLRIQWTTLPSIPIWLFLFAVAYTGHDGFLTRRTVGLLCAIPVLSALAAWTNPWHRLLWTEQAVTVVDGMAVMAPTFGPLFWVYLVYSYALTVVAMALLFRLVYQSEYLYADQSILLLVGIGAPFVVNVVDVFFLTGGPTVDYTPVAFTITGLAFGYALFRQRLFDLVPATRTLGRTAAIGQLDTGIVIVDTERRVVYCNAAAGDVLECEPADALGREIRSLVDGADIDFETEDALAEVERDGTVYEIRTSPVADRRDRVIGYTFVVHDVTARKRRERRLANQRDELATVNDLNAVIRGVNQALVSALGREDIERTVCDRIADADLYQMACVADIPTWTGDADRWTVVGSESEDAPAPPAIDDGLQRGTDGEADDAAMTPIIPGLDERGTWAVVPLVYGRTVYGALGLYTTRDAISERERSVLGELGETIGHAINAVETRQLLSAEAVVELELECTDEADPLVAASSRLSCRFDLEGVVPTGSDGPVAYVRVTGADAESARDELANAVTGEIRVVRESDSLDLLEWKVTGDSLLGTLVDHGANVQQVRADGGETRYELDVASGSNVRALMDHVEGLYRETRVLSKRERAGPIGEDDALPGNQLGELTDRQREVLEAAYRAGYFSWPRDSNAEEVAETLDISSATLHSHLRKAEMSILTDIFDGADDSRR